MRLEVQRFSSGPYDTLGILFDTTMLRRFLCFTLEDAARAQKVKRETRIPAGTYEVTLRREGGTHEQYSRRFYDMHKGMLWIRNVPEFEYILIHIGNTDTDTEGCLLVGDGLYENIDGKGSLMNSAAAYRRIYPSIAAVLEKGEKVEIKYIDFDRN
jgi:hypothetical protein